MAPRLPLNNRANHTVAHPVIPTQRGQVAKTIFVALVNLSDLIFGELAGVDRRAVKVPQFGVTVCHVVLPCSYEKMGRVDASRRVAPVANDHVFGDVATVNEPGEAVRLDAPPLPIFGVVEAPISVHVPAARPRPTAVFLQVNALLKTVFNLVCERYFHAPIIPLPIVKHAEAA